ncbi:MAG: hypothetical protein JO295_07545 [Verrucomicrobia bacterium]|nr:hypothetical protein [Verrucomicrobiota bacterium]
MKPGIDPSTGASAGARGSRNLPFRLAVAGLAAVAAATLCALAGALLQSHFAQTGVTPALAVVALALGTLTGGGAFFHLGKIPAISPRPTPCAWLMFLAWALFALRAFGWLLYPNGDALDFLSPNNAGDLPRHLLYARYFASGTPWWPAHPLDAWAGLRYYAGIDLFQSLLLSVGVPELPALVWVGLLGSAAAALALWRWGGAFAMAGFLFSGGLAGFAFFQRGLFLDYQKDLAWKNLALAIFVTQRGFLFALPAGLVLLTNWRARLFANPDGSASAKMLPFWLEALLYIALPFFQLYAFLFASALLGWWLVFAPPAGRGHIARLIAVALLPAGAEVWLMTGGFAPSGALWWKPGWMQERTPFLVFWLKNFGLFAPLAVAFFGWLAWRFIRRLDEENSPPGSWDSAAAFVLPSGLIFLACCFVMFAPWEWDNTKLMLWSYLATLPFLHELWLRRWRPAALRWAVCGALFFGGAVSLIGGISLAHQSRYTLIRRSELDAVRAAVAPLPRDARFACAPTHEHPLVFCGRRLAMGYAGALRGYGLDYTELEATLRTLMLGQPGWEEAARRLGVRYVFWGQRERQRYKNSAQPWSVGQAPVASGDWGAIYELTAER